MASKQEAVILDAEGRSLGRVASEAASLLRGKASASYERHIMPQQRVIIKNAARVRVTGRKMLQRTRERYSGYPGGLKRIPYQTVFRKSPEKFVREAVSGMIPRNRLKKEILKHLSVYAAGKK